MYKFNFNIKQKKVDVNTNKAINVKSVKEHNKLENLDYEHSGHTGFASQKELEAISKKVMTDDERAKLSGIDSGAQVNKIESIKVNGTEVKPDSNKEVNIPVDASGAAENAVSTHNTSSTAHSDIRTLVSNAQTTADNAQTKANEIEDLIVKNGVIDGSPRDVYENLSALQTAYPSGASGVYLTSDNGHWYYWNGSAWTDGGIYQATAGDIAHYGDKGTGQDIITNLHPEDNLQDNLYPNIKKENIPNKAIDNKRLSDDLKDLLSYKIEYNNVLFTDLQKGVFQSGVLNSNGNAGISSNTLYDVSNPIYIDVNNGYRCMIFKFTSGGVYTGVYYAHTDNFFIQDNTFKYKFQFGKADQSVLTQDDFNSPLEFVNNNFKVYYSKQNAVYSDELNNYVKKESIPQYWETTLSSKKTLIKSYLDYGKNVSSFVFITDLHWKTNAKKSPMLINDIVNDCNIPLVILGGDLIGGGSDETKIAIKKELTEINNAFSIVDRYRLTCIGNHDDNSISGKFSETLNTNEKFNYIERYTENYLKITYGNSGNYYFIDDNLNNIRYIITDCYDIPYEKEGTDGLKYNSMDIGLYREEQITWFSTKALNVPNDTWGVVVFSHNPINQGIVENDYLLMNILQAFNNKTSWTGSSLPSVRDEFKTSVSVDYTNKGGSAIAWISGHQHRDHQVTASTTYPIIVTTCDTITTDRTIGTITEQSFDVFTINRNTKTINATKIGYGNDRTFNYE